MQTTEDIMAEGTQRGSAARPRNVIIRAYQTKKHDGYMLRVDNFQAIARRNLASNPNVLANPHLNRKNVFVDNDYMDRLVGAARKDANVLSFHHRNERGTFEYDMLANVAFDRTDAGAIVPRPESVSPFVSASKPMALQDQARLIGVEAIDSAHIRGIIQGFGAMCDRNAKVGEMKREALERQGGERQQGGPAPERKASAPRTRGRQGRAKAPAARPVINELTQTLGRLPVGEYVARQQPGSSAIEVTRWQGSVALNQDGTFKSERGRAYASPGRKTVVGDLTQALPDVGGHGGTLEGKGTVAFFESDGKGGIGMPTVRGREDTRTGKWMDNRSPEDNMRTLLGAYDKSMAVRAAKMADAPVRAPQRQEQTAPTHEGHGARQTTHQVPATSHASAAHEASQASQERPQRAPQGAPSRRMADYDGPSDAAPAEATRGADAYDDMPF